MENIISRIKFRIIAAEKVYGIGSSVILMIFLSPFFIVFIISIFLQLSSTRPVVISIIMENQLVMRSLTSMFLIAGGFLGLRLVLQIKKQKKELLMFWFYLALSIGLLIIGMEKVRWGQQFFISEVPSGLSNINHQAETVIHSLQFWRKHLELLPMIFGFAGLFGVWISNRRHLSKISSPYILWPWFVIITIISGIDLFSDFYEILPILNDLVDDLEEVMEIMVSISGFLFIWLNSRRFRLGYKEIV